MDVGQVLPNLSNLASAGPGKLRQGSVSAPEQEGRGEARLSFTGLLCDLQMARIGRLLKAFRPGRGRILLLPPSCTPALGSPPQPGLTPAARERLDFTDENCT